MMIFYLTYYKFTLVQDVPIVPTFKLTDFSCLKTLYICGIRTTSHRNENFSLQDRIEMAQIFCRAFHKLNNNDFINYSTGKYSL